MAVADKVAAFRGGVAEFVILAIRLPISYTRKQARGSFMPTFVCRIGKADGTVLEERLEAENEADARHRLDRRGMVVFAIRPVGRFQVVAPGFVSSFHRGLPPREFLVFNQELLVLIKAGLPILRALDILAGRTGHPPFQRSLVDIREQVRGGSSLADAMTTHPRYFPELYVASLRAGERSGNVVEMLARYQTFLKRMIALRKKIVGALSYPAFLLVVGAGVILFLLAVVMPTFLDVYREAQSELPAATRWLIALVGFLRQWIGLVALGIIAAVVAFRFWHKTPGGRFWTDRLLLRLPLIGPIIRTHYTVSIARTLATILAGGIPLVSALKLVGESTPNRVVARHVEDVIERVKTGSGVAAAFAPGGLMSRMTLEMIEVGETTGALEEMLVQVGEFHEDELDRTLTQITTWVEPALLLLMGGLVAVVVITMYLPIFNLAGTIK
jgi:type IV pilus assembly protein PilC